MKATHTCSVDGCERPKTKRIWCDTHYQRWRTTGDPGTANLRRQKAPADGRCSIESCEGPHLARGWCANHYARWQRHGSTEDTRRGPKPARICEIDGCGQPHEARGYCDKHYQRYRQHGDPTRVDRPPRHGKHSGRWAGDEITYHAAHERVRAIRGRAPRHLCAQCGVRAQDWAYDQRDPNELVDPRGLAYSPDPARYIPLCRVCHRRFDRPPAS